MATRRQAVFTATVLLLLANQAAAQRNEISPRDVAAITTAIQSRGYNCPLAKRFVNLGPDAYGHAFQIFCGPPATDKYDVFATFRLTQHPNNTVSIQPCSVWLCEVTAD